MFAALRAELRSASAAAPPHQQESTLRGQPRLLANASPTVAEQGPPEPSNVNQLTLTPLLIARIHLPIASVGYRLAAPTRMVPQPKKDRKGEHPCGDSSFGSTRFEV